MKITIPFNIFIFIWSLIGVAGLAYSYIQDLAAGVNLFTSREFYSQVFWFLLCLLYCVQYLQHVYRKKSAVHGGKNMMTGEKVFLFILASVITSLSGCILIEDTTKVSQYELRRQHFEKYYGNDKDETFKKSMTREPAFDSIRRAGNRDSPPNPVPIEPPGL